MFLSETGYYELYVTNIKIFSVAKRIFTNENCFSTFFHFRLTLDRMC